MRKSYEERLHSLDLMPMQERLDRGDVVLMYKIMNNMADIGRIIFETSQETRTRGHDKKLQKYRTNLEVLKNYFTSRVVNGSNGRKNCYRPKRNTTSWCAMNFYHQHCLHAWINQCLISDDLNKNGRLMVIIFIWLTYVLLIGLNPVSAKKRGSNIRCQKSAENWRSVTP